MRPLPEKLFALLGFALAGALSCVGARAQMPAPPVAPLVAPGDASLSHVDLLVPDIAANRKFWIAMGGAPASWRGGSQGVTFGPVGIVLRKGEHIGPAIGSGINHIGLYVPDVPKAIAGWKAMGFKTEAGRNAQQAFVFSPDDLIRVEIYEMPGQTAPQAFHHVHYFVHPGVAGGAAEAQAWYARLLAATPGRRAQFVTDLLPGGELTFGPSASPTAPTAGRAVDHAAFNIKGLKALCQKLEAAGIRLDTPYARHPELGLAQAFLTDPWGNRIELDETL